MIREGFEALLRAIEANLTNLSPLQTPQKQSERLNCVSHNQNIVKLMIHPCNINKNFYSNQEVTKSNKK